MPHDAGYFEAHLQFLANYVERVSDGQTTLNTHLIPEVITVSRQMSAYSPTGLEASSDAELSKLAALVDEAWSLADEASTFDMSAVQSGNDGLCAVSCRRGPRHRADWHEPRQKRRRICQRSFLMNLRCNACCPGPLFRSTISPVNHTILMPRTESRLGFDFIQDVPFLVEFSINGLLAGQLL